MSKELFHGGFRAVTEIRNEGLFGGVFASPDEDVAGSHGDVLHRIVSPRHLTDYELNYEVEGAWEVAMDVANGNEDVANAIMSPGCENLDDCEPEDVADQGWEFQRLRGQVAARLGYTSVEMLDEHGTTYLCLPGCTIEVIA